MISFLVGSFNIKSYRIATGATVAAMNSTMQHEIVTSNNGNSKNNTTMQRHHTRGREERTGEVALGTSVADSKDFSTQGVASITLDVVSIGTNKRPEYVQAQRDTWGSHPWIRKFISLTEDDDTNTYGQKNCQKVLKYQQVPHIEKWCRKNYQDVVNHSIPGDGHSWITNRWIRVFGGWKKTAGWLCAQKRFTFGLAQLLQGYQDEIIQNKNKQGRSDGEIDTIGKNTTDNANDNDDIIPDYAIVVDDDTYVDVGNLYFSGLQNRNSSIQSILSGCMIALHQTHFIPYGGFGVLWSKATIQRLIEPLYCNNNNNGNNKGNNADTMSKISKSMSQTAELTCSIIKKNWIGELYYYKDGMSLIDVILERVVAEPFVDYKNWTLGYCFHGDHIPPIIAQIYQLVDSSSFDTRNNNDNFVIKPITRKDVRGGKTDIRNGGNCYNDMNGRCLHNASFCHRQNATSMMSIFQQKQQQQQQQKQFQ